MKAWEWEAALWANRRFTRSLRIEQHAAAIRLANGTATAEERVEHLTAFGMDAEQAAWEIEAAEAMRICQEAAGGRTE